MPVDTTNVKDAVRTFIMEELEWPGTAEELTDDTSLIQAGVIDSLSLPEVAHWIASEYRIAVQEMDLVAANFETLSAIEAFVRRGASA
ncbi:phosphopantetheine-binding protein [Kineosporia succinea]|uniref:Acyl carrier protein n=1 Tax=Kineosporia succinea TaxID=84632 RepID=A0ABT9PBW0_9ACTN|nr:phosphopantetheine-binding protein [Kineosporia succinea]MDP9830194.1 acyl carrier protein [Kineosporia succinea]